MKVAQFLVVLLCHELLSLESPAGFPLTALSYMIHGREVARSVYKVTVSVKGCSVLAQRFPSFYFGGFINIKVSLI